jgi:hypothetical protein
LLAPKGNADALDFSLIPEVAKAGLSPTFLGGDVTQCLVHGFGTAEVRPEIGVYTDEITGPQPCVVPAAWDSPKPTFVRNLGHFGERLGRWFRVPLRRFVAHGCSRAAR